MMEHYTGVRTIIVDDDGREIAPAEALNRLMKRMDELSVHNKTLEGRVDQLQHLLNVLVARQEETRLRNEGFGFQTR